MARKWNKIAAIGRKRITSPRSNNPMMANADNSNKSSVVGTPQDVGRGVRAVKQSAFNIPVRFCHNELHSVV
ncbi:hypothetical protein Gotri_023013, partial [Gossypium trilobum]|nr:hypothetical protein [Gossypium trilobum]